MVVDLAPALRQSLAVGLEAMLGVCAELAVRSVQAVLVTVVSVPGPAIVLITKTLSAPTASVPESVVWHVTTLPATVHAQFPSASAKLSSALSVSVTRIGEVGVQLATEGPTLRTVIVVVILAPGATGDGALSFLYSERSALGGTVWKETVAVLLDSTGAP
jgi:hypothetical protein